MLNKNFNSAIREQLDNSLAQDPQVLLLGLGVSDPKAFFDTTKGLIEKYGPQRILECPTSENAYLGHALGLALAGHKPIVHFQRMDFMLYAFDQLINNVAKWKSMFNTEQKISLVIRSLIGMGWGQGAQHSQNFANIFAQTPGLRVVAPSCPHSAAVLLKNSINHFSPTVFIEHRWLQFLEQKNLNFSDQVFSQPKALVRKKGSQLTVVTWSYSTAEALRFSQLFPEIDIEIIDLLYLNPIDFETINNSVKKTKKVLFWEPSTTQAGFSGEIIKQLAVKKISVESYCISHQFAYPASSPALNTRYYPSLEQIMAIFSEALNLQLKSNSLLRWPTDQDLSSWTPWV